MHVFPVSVPPASVYQISLNGNFYPVAPKTTLAEFMAGVPNVSVDLATAVNGEFVSRSQRQRHELHHGDEVTTFQLIVGG
jgi:thiamine biosynthesis protein ThiS